MIRRRPFSGEAEAGVGGKGGGNGRAQQPAAPSSSSLDDSDGCFAVVSDSGSCGSSTAGEDAVPVAVTGALSGSPGPVI